MSYSGLVTGCTDSRLPFCVTAICARDSGKAAVKKNVSSITCKRGDDGTKVSRDGTKLTVQLDPAKTSIVGKKPGATSWKSALEEIL